LSERSERHALDRRTIDGKIKRKSIMTGGFLKLGRKSRNEDFIQKSSLKKPSPKAEHASPPRTRRPTIDEDISGSQLYQRRLTKARETKLRFNLPDRSTMGSSNSIDLGVTVNPDGHLVKVKRDSLLLKRAKDPNPVVEEAKENNLSSAENNATDDLKSLLAQMSPDKLQLLIAKLNNMNMDAEYV